MDSQNTTTPDRIFMARAIEIAKAGLGSVAPNPMVGAVITRGESIVAEGFHAHIGGAHAERVAIENARNKGVDLHDTTLYVSLEPCVHHGKTPPCTEAIIGAGIKRVVIATQDPNPLVAGKGIELLKNSGIRVETGLLEEEAKFLNRRFFTLHKRKRPYIILKWAQTLDGFIDSNRKASEPPIWITNRECQHLVHKWRAQETALLVGTNTVIHDNPQLNVRYWHGHNPLRVILDRTLRIPPESNVFNGTSPTLVIAGNNQGSTTRGATLSNIPHLELVLVDFMKGIERILLQELLDRNITSLIVEGGALLINNFIKRGLWDEARVFIGNCFFKEGVVAPILPEGHEGKCAIGDCQLHYFRNPTPRGF